jgi:hypothetical protein
MPSQEILRILWHPNVCHSLNNSPPLVPSLSQIKPVHNFQFCSKYILILLSSLRLVIYSCLFPSCLLAISIEIQDTYVYFIFVINCLKCTQPISETKGCYLLGSNEVSFVEVPAVWINMLPQTSGQKNVTESYILTGSARNTLLNDVTHTM